MMTNSENNDIYQILQPEKRKRGRPRNPLRIKKSSHRKQTVEATNYCRNYDKIAITRLKRIIKREIQEEDTEQILVLFKEKQNYQQVIRIWEEFPNWRDIISHKLEEYLDQIGPHERIKNYSAKITKKIILTLQKFKYAFKEDEREKVISILFWNRTDRIAKLTKK